MLNSVNLLPIEDVKGKQKLTRYRKIYQLKNIDDETYSFSVFDMLVFKGDFNLYLSENRITLCYIIDDTDLALKESFGSAIKTYDINEDGTLKLHLNIGITKTHKKGI